MDSMARSVRRRWRRWFPVACVVAILVMGLGIRMFSGPDDGIEEGKAYKLAATYKVQIEYAPKNLVPGRVFDFADRNLPRTSIAVPMADDRGIALVMPNPKLPQSTVRKSRVQVPKRVVEDVVYPAYEYVLWEYNLSNVEIQSIDPPVVPKR